MAPAQPHDLAICYGIAADSALVSVPLLPDNRRVLSAAPAYVVRHGEPTAPADLAAHNCLRFRLGDEVQAQWRFQVQGQPVNITVTGNRVTDDGDAVRRWALAGQGLAYKSLLDVMLDLLVGTLVQGCQQWQGEAAPLSLICAAGASCLAPWCCRATTCARAAEPAWRAGRDGRRTERVGSTVAEQEAVGIERRHTTQVRVEHAGSCRKLFATYLVDHALHRLALVHRVGQHALEPRA